MNQQNTTIVDKSIIGASYDSNKYPSGMNVSNGETFQLNFLYESGHPTEQNFPAVCTWYQDTIAEAFEPSFNMKFNLVLGDTSGGIKSSGIQGILGLAPSSNPNTLSFSQTLLAAGAIRQNTVEVNITVNTTYVMFGTWNAFTIPYIAQVTI